MPEAQVSKRPSTNANDLVTFAPVIDSISNEKLETPMQKKDKDVSLDLYNSGEVKSSAAEKK